MVGKLEKPSTTKREDMLAVIMKLAEARVQARYDVLEASATEDIVVTINGNRLFTPFAGKFHGIPAARSALERLSIEFDYRNVEMKHIMIDGDQVGMRWRGVLRNRGTSAQDEFEGFLHLSFRDGKVCEYAAFVDTAALARLADWPSSAD